jgi:DNA-binding NtrC family response regulator
MKRVLLVDDETNILQALRRILTRAFRDEVLVESFVDPRAALTRAAEAAFDVVISDFRMPLLDGVSFLKAFREIQPDTVRMILSATTDFDALVTAVNEAEIHRYLIKPWADDEVVAAVRGALEKHALELEERRLADESRLKHGAITPEELEMRRLEEEEPGITRVKWGPDGSVLLDDD